VENTPRRYYEILWLTELWSNHAKVDDITLKSVWHWDSKISVINDPMGNQAAPLCEISYNQETLLIGAPRDE
jgi:hypothetical protein